MTKQYLFPVFLIGAMVAGSCLWATDDGEPKANTYTNPILPKSFRAGADPSVLLHNGTYYFYSTNPGLNVFTSKDLVHWKKGPEVLPASFKGVWAPDVYYHPEDGKFYMYYTKRYKIGVAVADKPDGMFKDLGFLVIPAIDAHLFRDDDRRLYLYFTNTPSFTMYCVPMKTPTQTGGPVTKCFEISQDWEKHSFAINEGPWMLKRNGRYVMLYSGSNGQSVFYAVGYATAPTPIGPFTKYAKNPVIQNLPAINGPGHGSVTRDRTGKLWHLYHQKTGKEEGWSRDICLDPVAFNEKGVFGGVPTRGKVMPAPNTDPNLVWSPDISPRGAIFNKDAKVTLRCLTPETYIRYTLDGSEPSETSLLYTKPFMLKQSAVVKAKAFKKGMKSSTISSERFTQTDKPLASNPSPNAPAGKAPFNVFAEPK